MADAPAPVDFDRLERSAAAVAQAAYRLRRMLRALAPVTDHMLKMRDTAAQLQAQAPRTEHRPAAAPATPRETPFRPGEPPTGQPDGQAPEAAVDGAAREPAAGDRRTVAVAVARADGPLDPYRIKAALAALPGVESTNITRLSRGRITLELLARGVLDEAALQRALAGVYPNVTGGWDRDGEYIAFVNPSSDV